MIARMRNYLGPTRLRLIFFLLAGTGLMSLFLNASGGDAEQVAELQTALLLIFIVGFVLIIASRAERYNQIRLLIVLAPSFVAFIIGLFVIPDLLPPLLGAALGWVVASAFLVRDTRRAEYKMAVKHLRRNEYAEAVKMMDSLIKLEPDNEEHYRFRAVILRIWGKPGRAKRDYVKVTELNPDSAGAYNDLAEVHLQMGEFEEALNAAMKAHELSSNDWVTAYNLGMIEDRLHHPDESIRYLQLALEHDVPDARHRLLIHFYLARAYVRKGELDAAEQAVSELKAHKQALKDWRKILDSEQSVTLRQVLGADIEAARALIEDELELAALS